MTLNRVLRAALLLFFLTSLHLHAQTPANPDFNTLRKEWVQALEKRDLEGSIRLYEPGATFINPDGTHVVGKEIRKLFETVFASFRAKIAMTPRTSEYSGVLGYESGSYDETITGVANGEPRHVVGDYVTIYCRREDGKWLIVQQAWTEAPSK